MDGTPTASMVLLENSLSLISVNPHNSVVVVHVATISILHRRELKLLLFVLPLSPFYIGGN